ncbi:MAG: hypothetical protein JW953_00055 [Anaerolineae bacterium]|nr:hypothetical protein [Anaerolineae bacterium]
MPDCNEQPSDRTPPARPRIPRQGVVAGVILLLMCGILILTTGGLWLAEDVFNTPTAVTTSPTPLETTVENPSPPETAPSAVGLWLEKTTFGPREPIPVHFEAPASFPEGAWVGIMPAETPHGTWDSEGDYVSFEYLAGQLAGIIEFTAPDALGTYDVRIYDQRDQETAMVTFTVISDEGKAATLQLNKTRFEQGEQIRAHFAVPSSFSDSAWIGLLSAKTPHGPWQDNYGYGSYENLNRRVAGVVDFTAPSTSGPYDLRLYDSTYGQEAASVTFTVIAGAEKKPSLRLNQTTFQPGEKIEVHFTAPASFLSTAWVGIVPSAMSAHEYKYNFPHKPLNRMTAGVLIFTAPLTPGLYDVRMNDAGEHNGRDVASITFKVGNK